MNYDAEFEFSHVRLANFKKRSCSMCLHYLALWFCVGGSILLLLTEILISTNILLSTAWVERVLRQGLIAGIQQTTIIATTTSSSTITPFPYNTISLPNKDYTTIAEDVLSKVNGEAMGWVVLGSVGLSVCVWVWEWMIRARSIIRSDYISQAFVDRTAFRLWSLKSYSHFCLLIRIPWGRTIRQRMVMGIYFGQQGWMSALVIFPRLIIYGSILYAACSVPEMELFSYGLQQLQFEGSSSPSSSPSSSYSSLEGGLLKATLMAIVISFNIHILRLLRVLLSSIVGICIICCIGQTNKAMRNDLISRIATLIDEFHAHSDDSQDHTKGIYAGWSSFDYEYDQIAMEHDQPQGNGQVMKSETTQSIADHNHSRPDNMLLSPTSSDSSSANDLTLLKSPFINTEKGINNEKEKVEILATRTTVVDFPTSSLAPLAAAHITLPSPVVLAAAARNEQSNTLLMTPQQPNISVEAFGEPQLTAVTTNVSVDSPQTVMGPIKGLTTKPNKSHPLPSSSYKSTLSSYDDLLKSINAEKILYQSPLLHQSPTGPLQQQRGWVNNSYSDWESDIPVNSQSTTMHSIVYRSGFKDRVSIDRAVHPFDTIEYSHSTSTIQTYHQPVMSHNSNTHNSNNNLDTLMMTNKHIFSNINNDIHDEKAGIRASAVPHQEQGIHLIGFSLMESLSRSEGLDSQETIEYWRTHVEPSSPTIPTVNYGDISRDNEGSKTGQQPQPQQYGLEDIAMAGLDGGVFDGVGSRRGTLPITSSSRCLVEQPQTLNCTLDSPSLHYSTADLGMPRPSYAYAYGQLRTQRQGSMSSSADGYSCSIASSLSLADSLSNPMYHQQLQGLAMTTNAPTARHSSHAFARLPRKYSLPSSVHKTSPRLPPSQYNTRRPSRLSSMMANQVDDEDFGLIECATNLRPQQLPLLLSSSSPFHKKSHYRSHSLGYWPPAGAKIFNDIVQDDDPTMIDHTPALPPGTIIFNAATNGNDYERAMEHNQHQSLHPLDSPPLLQQHHLPRAGSDQGYFYDYDGSNRYSAACHGNYVANNFTKDVDVQAAWTKSYIGLGLTFGPTDADAPMHIDNRFLSRLNSIKDHTDNYSIGFSNDNSTNDVSNIINYSDCVNHEYYLWTRNGRAKSN